MTGKNRRNKKKRSESDDEFSGNKRINTQKSPGGFESISQVLGEANSVLYDEEINVSTSNLFEPLTTWNDNCSQSTDTMEDRSGQHTGGPTNSDIIALLGKMDLKLNDMDTRLKTLDGLEKKVDNFDKELKKLWLHIDSSIKENSVKLNRVEHKVDSVDIELEGARKRIADLERDKDKLKYDMNYVQSQTMRNNLIFGNIPEDVNETPAKCDEIVREFIEKNLKIAKETVANMRFERFCPVRHKFLKVNVLQSSVDIDLTVNMEENGSSYQPPNIYTVNTITITNTKMDQRPKPAHGHSRCGSASCPHMVQAPTVISMVGLPARGKTYMSKKLTRYLNWIGIRTKVFNVGEYRRAATDKYRSHVFFDTTNSEALAIRQKCALMAIDDACSFLKGGGEVAVIDATNTTRERRKLLAEIICDRFGFRLFFEVKVCSPDYLGMDKNEAVKDFMKRIEHYSLNYQSLDYSLDKTLSFIQIFNQGERFLVIYKVELCTI
ncbi:F26-like protein [Mya arenaria]|uniref:F26-like protein n=1 Tax=Mya arenaria TaxID=6604 RepID=A0ABY7G0W9_MYAAR|nr:F26-like protein [Mya arenaria]